MLPMIAGASDYIPEDYVWTTQSKNSSESMPCGGGDIGMNVWVENGDILIYASRSGWFDENNTLLKAGRFRIKLSPNPFNDGDFKQILRLSDGAIYIKGKNTEVRLWADVFSPVIYAEINAQKKTNATFSYESWRYKDRPVTKAECQQCSYKWVIPKDCHTLKDSVIPGKSSLTFYHQNRQQTVFDFTVTREHLDEIKDKLYNPIGGLKFGGKINAPAFSYSSTEYGLYASTDYQAWNYVANNIGKTTITIDLDINSKQTPVKAKESRKRSAKWWNEFWQRSYITTDSKEAKGMVRNYELFRYMLGCNAYSKWPTKFNGGLFTFDPVYADSKCPFTPDYRRWGGGTMTAQNQRLVYWPMLKSGDTDMMKAQFDTYLRMLPNAVERTKFYWGHNGASFTEQIENFGLPNPAEYGKHKEGMDYGMERNAWLEYQWDTALEFCMMIIQANKYAGMDITEYQPIIKQCLTFFEEHYRYLARKRGVKELNGEGKLVLYPSSGCETHKMAYNPSSVIAALRTVLNATGDTTMIKLIPEIPLHTIDGATCIAPAVVWERIQNVESPQLYPVFPWRIYGMGRPDIEIARNTYMKDPHVQQMRSHNGWKQDNIWAACLGLTEEAKKLNLAKFADGPYRFPAFWSPGFDWAPDCNRGGSAMIGLQEMLLQEAPDGGLLLFQAWPKEWNVRFRLHATDGRVVEAEMKDGKETVINTQK